MNPKEKRENGKRGTVEAGGPSEKAIKLLNNRILVDEKFNVRRQAAEALTKAARDIGKIDSSVVPSRVDALKDESGMSALELAERMGNKEIAELLRECSRTTEAQVFRSQTVGEKYGTAQYIGTIKTPEGPLFHECLGTARTSNKLLNVGEKPAINATNCSLWEGVITLERGVIVKDYLVQYKGETADGIKVDVTNIKHGTVAVENLEIKTGDEHVIEIPQDGERVSITAHLHDDSRTNITVKVEYI